MSVIQAGNTTTTSLIYTGDTTGNLVFTTGGANTVALTIDSTQNITTTNKFAAASMPTGCIIQVVSTTNVTTTSTTSSSYVTTGIGIAITPKFATSKILVRVSGGQIDFNQSQAVFTLYRNSTDLAPNSYGLACFYNTAAAENQTSLAIEYLDSPATTSSTTYTMYFKRTIAGSGSIYTGTNGNGITITAMEVAS